MELLFHFKRRDHRWRPYLVGGTGAKEYRGQVHVMLSQAEAAPPALDLHRIINP
jgi:hypothetical protein